MTLNEALAFAEKCKEEGNISTSAKALVVMYETIAKLKEMAEEGSSTGDFAWALSDVEIHANKSI